MTPTNSPFSSDKVSWLLVVLLAVSFPDHIRALFEYTVGARTKLTRWYLRNVLGGGG